MSSFNKVAPIYDQLAWLVFGNNLKNARRAFLDDILPGSRVLIVGGGTGWILEELDALQRHLDVVYIDSSAKMIDLAKCRNVSELKVEFVHDDFLNWAELDQFDCIITNFFLDVFDEEVLSVVEDKALNSLKPEGIWLVTDFSLTTNTGFRFWKVALIKVMYAFFRLTAGLKSNQLQHFEQRLQKKGLNLSSRQCFYHDMVHSWKFKKII